MLTALCALLYLPGLTTIPPLDRDESRFAQASKQMVETGDFIGIYFQDQPRNKKPAGIHWLQAATVALLRGAPSTDIWLYRLPSALGAWIAVLLTFATGCVLFNRIAAFWGAALLACCIGLVVEAHMATTDAVLLATVTAAQWALAVAYVGARGTALPGDPPHRVTASGSPAHLRWPVWCAFWSALGIGVLIKGPIGFAVTLLTAVCVSIVERDGHWLRSLRPVAGAGLLAVWLLPWFLAVTLLTDTQFVSRALSEDLIAKLLQGQEGHGAPPGYHVLALIVFLWPASLFIVPALVGAWTNRAAIGVRFCLAWVLPAWLMFELVPTKLPHYVLPTYPALTLLIGATLWTAAEVMSPYRSRTAQVCGLVWMALTILLAVALVVAGAQLGDGTRWWAMLGGATMLLAGVLPGRLLLGAQPRRAVTAVVGCATLVVIVLAGVYVPRLERLWISPAVAAAIQRVTDDSSTAVVSVDFREPSLVFLLGTHTVFADAPRAAQLAAANGDRVVVVAEQSRAPFLAALARLGAHARTVATVEGLNYSKGQPLRLELLVVEAAPVVPGR